MPAPPLNALNTFLQVAQTLSFKEAADQLCLSPSAVSRQVQGLEQAMGVLLFLRGNRSITLTPEGQVLLQGVEQAFSVLDSTFAAMTSRQNPKVLRVGAQQYFSNNWLFPRLSDFIAEHPGIEIQFDSSQTYQPFDPEACDICIRLSPAQQEGVCCEPFFPQQAILVAAPELAETYDLQTDLSQVMECDWLAVRSQPSLLAQWLHHVEAEMSWDTSAIDTHPVILFDDAQAALTAAKEGVGVVLAATPLIDRLLANQDLVQIGGKHPAFVSDYYLVYSEALRDHPPLQAFRAWLIAETAGALAE